MKRLLPLALVLTMLFTACSESQSSSSTPVSTPAPAISSEVVSAIETPAPTPEMVESTESAPVEPESQPEEASQSNILIAYFTLPEDVSTDGVDAISGASIIMRDGVKLGSCEFVAKTVQETIGGDLFQIETVQQYPLDHDPLVDQAADEKAAELRPELATQIENPDQYDTIILGYPNWWADLPMPVYAFLENYDFSGKTIIPFVTHGGSGFSNTVATIARLQPGAAVSENTLSLSRNDVANSESEVIAWAQSLGLN